MNQSTNVYQGKCSGNSRRQTTNIKHHASHLKFGSDSINDYPIFDLILTPFSPKEFQVIFDLTEAKYEIGVVSQIIQTSCISRQRPSRQTLMHNFSDFVRYQVLVQLAVAPRATEDLQFGAAIFESLMDDIFELLDCDSIQPLQCGFEQWLEGCDFLRLSNMQNEIPNIFQLTNLIFCLTRRSWKIIYDRLESQLRVDDYISDVLPA